MNPGAADFSRLVGAAGPGAQAAIAVIRLEPAIAGWRGDGVPRAVFAMAVNVALFADLIARAPTAAAYVADRRAAGEAVVFDHGALRTIRFGEGPTGALPAGEAAFTRILEPLGYRLAGVYPLDRLGMTGRAYAHLDHPQSVPQFFLSEFHVDRFDSAVQAAAHRVFDSSGDPLGEAAQTALAAFAADGAAPLDLALAALPQIVAAFGRQHREPTLEDYRALLAASPEAAWIATEGNVFNHATDRVADVEAVAAAQKALGRPMKPEVEVSASGRVRQTAFRADPVSRSFREADGSVAALTVPGSFYEFITRGEAPEGGGLDLRFDSANAQGIFKMTAAA